MTDNEIIKALECCVYWESDKSCEDCPENTYGFGCGNKLAKHSLDLINRQKAEIEGLNIELQSMRSAANSYKTHYETAKSDAIKEFAHFVIDRSRNGVIYKSDIPDLVKEMTEV